MFGARARISALLPAVNTTLEGEAALLLPADVSFHASRFQSVESDGSKTYSKRGLSESMLVALRNALAPEPQAVLLGCTTATFLHGAEYDDELTAGLTAELERPFFTAAGSALNALQTVGARRPALISPYDAATDARVVAFLEGAGMTVAALGGPPGLSSIDKGSLPPWAPIRAAAEIDLSDADAIFLSCTNWQTLSAIPALEDIHQIPVISSNQALFWRVLHLLEIDVPQRFGSLFTHPPRSKMAAVTVQH